MARASRPTKGGPGFLVQIILIVLCLVLIGGYVWLVPHWAKRGTSLTQIQKDIKDQLEGPLSATDPTLTARSTVSADDAAYDSAFFTKVSQYAAKGMKYDALVAKSGYDSTDSVVNELKTAGTPEPENLKAYIAKLKLDFENRDHLYQQANTDLALAVADRDRIQKLFNDEHGRLAAALDDNAKELAAAQKKYDQTLALYKQKMDQAVEDEKKDWAENRAEADRHKKEAADKDAQIAKLKDDLAFAQQQLELKKPKAVAVTEGHILQADAVDGIAIIDLGKREGIQNGEKFNIMQPGKGGVRTSKGELQVIRVDDLVSQTEVIQTDKDNPIMRDDIVEREKKTE